MGTNQFSLYSLYCGCLNEPWTHIVTLSLHGFYKFSETRKHLLRRHSAVYKNITY